MAAKAVSSGIVELRVYTVRIPRFAEFLHETSRLLHLRLRHSPLLGYWICESPNLNRVVHIWHYESLSHRAAVRSALSRDRQWTESYIKPHLHTCVTKQNNSFLTAIGNFNPISSDTNVVHELEVLKLSRIDPVHQRAVEQLCLRLHDESSQKSRFIGGLRTVIGSNNEIVLLHEHESADQILENQSSRSQIYGELDVKITSLKSQLLIPHHIAPETS